LKGYDAERRHVATCDQKPAIAAPVAEATIPEEIIEVEAESEPVPEAETEPEPEPVADPSFDNRLKTLEAELVALPKALENINIQMGRIPDLVHQSVVSILQGKPAGDNGKTDIPQEAITTPAPPAEGTAENPPGKSNLGGDILSKLGIKGGLGDLINALLSQIDINEILKYGMEKKTGGDINTIIAQKVFGAAKKTLQTGDNMKYFTRGIGHTQSALRMKNVDPMASAISITAQSDAMLKEKLTEVDRIYWMGRKAEADAFITGRTMEATKLAETKPETPELKPAAPAETKLETPPEGELETKPETPPPGE